MRLFRRRPDPNAIAVVGARHTPFGDLYHLLLRLPWWVDLLGVSAVFLVMNLVFACAYVPIGGVSGARPRSLLDHFFFSVQTMGTIGYGAMYPLTAAAETNYHQQVRWGARHADMLSERADGTLQLDMGEFHRIVPTLPTATFPYPRSI